MPNPGQELSSLDFESMIGGPLVAVVNAQAQAAMSTVNFIKEVGFKRPTGEQDPAAPSVNEPIYVQFKYQKEVSPYVPKVGAGDGSISIAITDGGAGYAVAPAAPPAVTIAAPPAGGTQATATAVVDAAGTVTNITVNIAGAKYTSAPAVTLAAPPAGGRQATATATVAVPEVPAQIQDMKLDIPILTIVPVPFIRVANATIDFNAKINAVEYRKTDTSIKVDGTLEAKAGWLWGSAKLKVSTAYQRSTSEGTNVERTYSMAINVRAVQDEMPPGLERVLGILEDSIRGQPVSAPPPAKVT